jgi:hypothetical protein
VLCAKGVKANVLNLFVTDWKKIAVVCQIITVGTLQLLKFSLLILDEKQLHFHRDQSRDYRTFGAFAIIIQ